MHIGTVKWRGEGWEGAEAMIVRGEMEVRVRVRVALASKGSDDETASGRGADTCNNT